MDCKKIFMDFKINLLIRDILELSVISDHVAKKVQSATQKINKTKIDFVR